jgi:hypothetical protein
MFGRSKSGNLLENGAPAANCNSELPVPCMDVLYETAGPSGRGQNNGGIALAGSYRIVDRHVGSTGERDADTIGGESEILRCFMTSIAPEMKIMPLVLALAALVS